ncbi:hypothetical protein AVEN_20067-1 [Araneus ventricosus]|uniref:Uncharacterized protein n=1 Tax=Araneus ventricosus TaxID=182803 RepID=A0A4Y2JX54_ARAVE|nr:hypothetical protein AVEN_20067-1 [Araneus ventricosus]
MSLSNHKTYTVRKRHYRLVTILCEVDARSVNWEDQTSLLQCDEEVRRIWCRFSYHCCRFTTAQSYCSRAKIYGVYHQNMTFFKQSRTLFFRRCTRIGYHKSRFPLTPQQPRRGANTVNDISRRSRTGTRARGISLIFVDEFGILYLIPERIPDYSARLTGEMQLQFQSRYHMGRSLTLPLCLLVLAGNNGVAFTPWVALPLPTYITHSSQEHALAALRPLTDLRRKNIL